MKKYILGLLCCFLLGITACIDDKGNYDYLPVEAFDVQVKSGIEEEYIRDAMQKLEIIPEFGQPIDESEYEFCWYVYATPNPSKADTISWERNLSYVVTLGSGDYKLTYQVRNKRNGICTYKQVKLKVASIYNDVWVVAKDNGSETDLDVVTADGRVLPDVLAMVNEGQNLRGTAIKAGYINSYNYSYTDGEGNVVNKRYVSGLVMMTSEEVKIYDMDNMGQIKDYADCFFGPVPGGKPVWCCAYNSGYAMIINNRIYVFNMSGGFTGKFSEKAGLYKCGRAVVPPGFSSNTFVFFDENTQSFLRLAGSDERVTDVAERSEAARPCNNMGCDVGYIEDQFVFPNKPTGLALFRDEAEGKYYSAELSADELSAGVNPLKTFAEVAADCKVGRAKVFAANQYVPTMYFGHPELKNELWSYDFTTRKEKKQLSLPAGEEIVYAKHVVAITKTVSPTEREYMSAMAVLTNTAGRWKLYILDFVGETQDIDETSKSANPPSGEGNGRYVMFKNSRSMSS